jgi:2'-5' RNA ligase
VSRLGDAPGAGAEAAWRCFVAVSLVDPARTAVAEYLASLRATVAGVGWVRPEQLHLTLKFLGNVAPARIAALEARLIEAVGVIEACTAEVAGVGAFPNLARPQVLWVGVRAPSLAALADAVEASAAAEGFARETRPFRPHVTLGRVRERGRRATPEVALLARDGDRAFGTSPLRDVTLFRSVLGAGGARHGVLGSFRLAGGAGFP